MGRKGMQLNNEIAGSLDQHLEEAGYGGKIVAIEHLGELESEIMGRRRNGLLDPELYEAYLASFDFICHRKFKNARSLIIVSAPQPQVRLFFVWQEQAYPVIIPPTYSSITDKKVADLVKTHLNPRGYRLQKVRLPEKLLAVRSGLARYGKNNITYVAGMGSFHRPVAFISDAPCTQDSWGEPTMLDLCESCKACGKACPTEAIGTDRFQLHAERCLTFHNERSNDFPKWLSPAWHNSLVGCMICQRVCPANKDVIKWIEAGATFDGKETALILNRVPDDRLPPATLDKLKKLDIMEYYPVLARNLRALIEKSV